MGVVDAASVRAIHAATTLAKSAPGERVCGTAPTRKRPSHEPTGIGRFPHLYSENGLLGEMATNGGVLALAVATLSLRAACRSSTWAYRDLSQSILFHPLSGWPFIHTQHKRLLPEPSRIPHHQYALSASRPPESNDPFGPVRRSSFRSRSEAVLRTLCNRLEPFEGAEHVTSVTALPQEPPEWVPDLCEEVVAQVE